jgi:hypothetical protein
VKATITNIDYPKEGTQGRFIRVYFSTETGGWAKTDLVRGFRNFKFWEPHLEIGAVLDNLQWKALDTIDADSRPVRVRVFDLPPHQPTIKPPPAQREFRF